MSNFPPTPDAGAPAPQPTYLPAAPTAPTAPAQRSQGIAIAALITGLIGLVVLIIFLFMPSIDGTLLWLAIVPGVAGLVLGIIALVKRQHKAMAIIGLIAGAFTVLFAIALFAFAMVFVGAFMAALG